MRVEVTQGHKGEAKRRGRTGRREGQGSDLGCADDASPQTLEGGGRVGHKVRAGSENKLEAAGWHHRVGSAATHRGGRGEGGGGEGRAGWVESFALGL